MSRSLSVFLPITSRIGEAQDVLADDPVCWLPGEVRASGPRMYRIELGALGMQRPVVCTVGSSWLSDQGLWRRLSWYPAADGGDMLPMEWALPSFDGEIGAHSSPDGGVSLVLNGSYDVPGARLGELLDAVALSGVARRTGERLLTDVARRILDRSSAAV
jgi:hypothetical protein